tara:strand:+ start:1429 stop:2661 length:1233 start_codon:yes stop_codon:yes gene_type:complete
MKSVRRIPNIEDIKEKDFFEIKSNNTRYTHSFFKYPAKFIPEIPNWFIRNFTKENETVLDCFCGSGTSLVEASLMNRVPLGIDFDPLSRLLTKTKTTQLSRKDIQFIKNNSKQLTKFNRKRVSPKIKNLDHWFDKNNIKKLSNIIANVNTLDLPNERIRNFYLVMFASIIRRSSFADNVSPKPYVSTKVKKVPKDSYELFLKEINKNLSVFKSSDLKSKKVARIIGKDARSRISFNNLIDHVITSPPYINAFDYVRVLRLENIWLDHFNDDEILDHKKIQIGNEIISSAEYKKIPTKLNIRSLDNKIRKLYKVDKMRAYVVLNYFIDMEKSFNQIYACMREEGYFCIVVGNCSIRGIDIDTQKYFGVILEKIGFKFVRTFNYKIKNPYLRIPRKGRGGIIKRDHVIVVQK